MAKRHKLFLVTPSGEEVELGFMSPSRNGFILGRLRVEGANTSHLTIIAKKDTLSSHITPQENPQNRRYFPQLNLKDFANTLQKVVEQNLVSLLRARELSSDQLSEEVVFVTQRFLDWLDSVKNTLYEKRTSPKYVIHVLNFEQLLEKLPQLIGEFKASPSSFFGLCKAKEILEDNLKILGVTKSRLFLIPVENHLYHANFLFVTGFNPVLEQQEVSSLLSEIYRSMGIYQYMQEVEKKKIVEKLLSKTQQ